MTRAEKQYLRAKLEEEQVGKQRLHGNGAIFAQLLRDPRVYLLALAYSFTPWAISVLNFWGPAIIRGSGIGSPALIGLLTTIPNIAGAISMITVGRHSDRLQERRWHFMASVSTTAVGALLLATFHTSWIPAIVFLTLVSVGQYGAFSVFWSIPPTYLSKSTAAIGIAIVSSLGQISGLLSSWVLGVLSEVTGSMVVGLYAVAAIQIATGLIVVVGFRNELATAHTAR
ncbi:MFS transporter [Bradyrhizobium sp. UFLA05-109]